MDGCVSCGVVINVIFMEIPVICRRTNRPSFLELAKPFAKTEQVITKAYFASFPQL